MVDGSGSVNLDNRTIKIADTVLDAAGTKIRADGSISEFTDRKKMYVDLSIAGEGDVFDILVRLFPDLEAFRMFKLPAVKLNISGSPDDLQVSFFR